MSESGVHAFWIQPMPGVENPAKVQVAHHQLSMIIVLPDDSQLLITADRAMYSKGGYSLTLSQWQMVPEATPEPKFVSNGTVPDAIPGDVPEEVDPISFERPFGRTRFRA